MMREKEHDPFDPFDPFIDLLRPDEEILWMSRSQPMSLMKPLMDSLKICAIWGLILFTIAFCIARVFPLGGDSSASAIERNEALVKTFANYLLLSLPVILVVYGLYWWIYQYQSVATYAVTNERLLSYHKRKTTAWKLSEIKKIHIVGDDNDSLVTFTRDGGQIMTWNNITDVESILQLIRERHKTPVLVNRLPR